MNIDPDYQEWIQELGKRFRQSQIKAAVKVNSELLRFYWSLGEDIVKKQVENKYGAGILKKLSRDLREAIPNVAGFSQRNLYYIKRFYLVYNQAFEKVQQVVAKSSSDIFSVPWGHHCIILDKAGDNPEKALFFVHKTIENGWSRSS